MGAKRGAKVRTFRLRPEVLAEFAAKPGDWITRTHFSEYFRKEKKLKASVEREWTRLINGFPVEPIIAEAFVQYLREKLGMANTIKTTFLEVPDEGIWRSVKSFSKAMPRFLRHQDAMMLGGNRIVETELAVKLILKAIGQKFSAAGDAVDDASCIARGEVELMRTARELIPWLLGLMKGQDAPRIICFIVKDGERLGATIMLPLKDGAFAALCAGELNHFDITADDLDLAAGKPYLMAACEPKTTENLGANASTGAQARTVMYQIAYFTRNLAPYRPTFATIESHPDYVKRLRRGGFRPTGAKIKGTRLPVTRFSFDPDANSNRPAKFMMSLFIWGFLRSFQFANRAVWEKEDEIAGLLRP